MRIIAGSRKSRNLKALDNQNTRPTLDKVKEACFSKIGNEVIDCKFLDLFAGSGNIGLEALSRGASHCDFVEGSKDALKIIQENVIALDFKEESSIYHMDAFQACRYFKNKAFSYDIVYCDPPYNKVEVDKILKHLIPITHLNSLIIFESNQEIIEINEAYSLEKSVKYGTVILTYIRRNS